MLELAYIAGIFDGEGWITVSHWKNAKKKNPLFSQHYVRYQLVVGVANTNKPLIDAIHAQCGGAVHASASAYRKNPKNRVAYSWRISSRQAAHFLKSILPFLIAKRDEAILAIKLQEHVDEFKNVVRYYPDQAEEIYSYRQELTDQIRCLKKRRFDLPNSDDAHLSCMLGS